ncbi:hypothetical protein [Okeania sp. SIO2G5]|uniref:hypothetical protein n=1 Tax=Okeania sp. SIO2G5 TaxID=2607796 RepID=UPI00257D8BDD|nr:hypothetical protein [Okeania sp. SIO2G5]
MSYIDFAIGEKMLIFFIHGVATRNTDYAKPLQKALSEGLLQNHCPPAHYKAGFWGDVLNPLDDGTIQNHISTDLHNEMQKADGKVDVNDLFRYRKIREEFISPFVVDLMSYLTPTRGRAIRQKLADQLIGFAKEHPNEKELHIVCHSLGTVILWDSLFQSRYHANDPALRIRQFLGLGDCHTPRMASQLRLKSITTMGSPILYMNTMLGIKPETIKQFAQKNAPTPLKWLNIIHASDVIAYPLRSSLKMDSSWNLRFEDKFVKWHTKDDVLQQAARTLSWDAAAMALSTQKAHCNYWEDPQVQHLILSQQLVDHEAVNKSAHSQASEDYFEDVKSHLKNQLAGFLQM